MGTFGANTFDNDAALDWLEAFSSRKTIKSLEKTLDAFEQSNDKATEEEVLACCDVVAAIMGYPSDDLPPEIEEWSDKQREKLDANLISKALKAVEIITSKSELSKLWGETDAYQDWLAVQEHLISRLEKKPLEPGENKARRPPILKIRGPRCGMDAKPYRITESLPKLNEDIPNVGVASDVILSLSQDISEDEIELVANWISNYPNVLVWFLDYPKRKAFPVNTALLAHFSLVEKMCLAFDNEKSLSFIECFSKLENLQLHRSKANKLFESLSKLPRLRELKLHECEPKQIVADLPSFSKLNNLLSLEITFIRSGLLSVEGSPIQCKVKIDSLPKLPQHLEQLAMSCIEIEDIQSLANSASLRKIDIVALRTNTECLDLSKLTMLQRLELVGVAGMRNMILPPNLTSLQLQNTYGLKIILPQSVERLVALRIDADIVCDGEVSKLFWKQLRYAALSGKQSFLLASELKSAPELEFLGIDGGNGEDFQFTQFHKLKFVQISNFEGAPELIASLGHLSEIVEIVLIYKLDGARKPKVEDFAPLKSLKKLERVNISSVDFAESEEEEVARLLGVQVNNRKRSKADRFLTIIENQLLNMQNEN